MKIISSANTTIDSAPLNAHYGEINPVVLLGHFPIVSLDRNWKYPLTILMGVYYFNLYSSHVSKVHLAGGGLTPGMIEFVVGLPTVLFMVIAFYNPGLAAYKFRGGFIGTAFEPGAPRNPDLDTTPKIRSPDIGESDDLDGQVPGPYTEDSYCHKCNIYQSKGVVHCLITDVCVKGYRGYFKLIGKPVGKYNSPLLVLFLFFQMISALLLFAALKG